MVNENSLKNLSRGKKFSKEDGSATAAGRRSAEVRKVQAKMAKELEKMANLMTKQCTMKEFQDEVTKEQSTQAMRIFALNAQNPVTAMSTLDWLCNRILGKPKQVTETSVEASVQVSKPAIVFKDIAGEDGQEE